MCNRDHHRKPQLIKVQSCGAQCQRYIDDMTTALRLMSHSAGLILNESILIGSQKIFDK